MISSTGIVDIDYQGDTIDANNGCVNSTFDLNMALSISGTLKAGSLYLDAPTVTVGSTGSIDVSGGGYLAASGPGNMANTFLSTNQPKSCIHQNIQIPWQITFFFYKSAQSCIHQNIQITWQITFLSTNQPNLVFTKIYR